MAWTFNSVGSKAQLPSGSYLDIPNGDWSFSGWFRQATNSGTTYRRLLTWGVAGDTPSLQVFVVGSNGAIPDEKNHLGARFIDPSGNTVGALTVDSFVLSTNLNKWLGWILTHDDSTDTTYLQLYDSDTNLFYSTSSVQALGGISDSDIVTPFQVGGPITALDSLRFKGDLAEMSFVPGLFAGPNQAARGLLHGSRGFRLGGGWDGGWNLPMLGGRTELWGTGNSVVTPNTTNVTLTTYDGPPLRLIGRAPPQMVLDDPLEPHATSTLAFVSSAGSNHQPPVSTSNTLSFTQNVVAVRDVPVSANNILTLTDVAGQTFTLSREQLLSITGIVNHLHIANDRLPVGHSLNLTQLVEVAGSSNIEQDLGLTQTVNISFPIKPVIIQILGIGHHTATPHRAFIEDPISFRSRVDIPLPTQVIVHTLNFVQDAPIGNVENTLNFVQTVLFSKSLTAFSIMNLVSDMSRIMIYDRTFTHDNAIGHALTWLQDTPCGRKQYTPFQGENTIPMNVNTPRNTLLDPQGEDSTFKLYQPALGVHTSEVELRQPELDNRDRNAFSRVSQETRGGKLLVFADPTWPRIRTLAVTIVGLTETKVDELQTFIQSTVGQIIGLTDWEGRLWSGFITTPNEQATQDGKKRWTVTFEFEGEMLDVQQAGEEGDGNGMAMNLSHSVTAVIV